MPSIHAEVARALVDEGVDLEAIGVAWARAIPTVVLVPAFGLRALPVAARLVIALALAACVFPAVAAPGMASGGAPWHVGLALEFLRGVPIALAAAIPLWAATMAGGIFDALRGAFESVSAPTVEGRPSPTGVPLSLLACSLFFSTGGAARVARAIAFGGVADHPLLATARELTAGIAIALALGAPVLAAATILEIACALVARVASPAPVYAAVAPLRSLALIAIFGLVIDRIAAVMEAAIAMGSGL